MDTNFFIRTLSQSFSKVLYDSSRNRERSIEAQTASIKRRMADELEAFMKRENLSKSDMVRRMNIQRPQFYRLLDPDNENLQVKMLLNAAATMGRKLRIELI